MNEVTKERLIELLTDQTLFGLDEQETAELNQLRRQFPEWENDNSFELAAAAVNVDNLDTSEELPANLRAKILADADDFFGVPEKAGNVVSFPVKSNETAVSSANRAFENSAEKRQPFWQWLGWGIAAAACLTLAINLWLTRSRPAVEEAKTPQTVQTPGHAEVSEAVKTPEVVITPEIAELPDSSEIPAAGELNETSANREIARKPGTAKTPEIFRTPNVVKTPEIAGVPKVTVTPESAKPMPIPASAAQQRAQLLASAPDIIQTSWTSKKDDKTVLGDVVWSSAQQKGYVRLRDMPALDPNRETYQLWIVDEAQDKKAPVSGGIFNVGQAGEVIVPINAQLKIQKPKMFVISREKAGGVAVSKPNRFVAVAKM